jgi:uncharacterized protein (DUF1684 family)
MLPVEFRATYNLPANSPRKICKFNFSMPDANYIVQVMFRQGDVGYVWCTDATTTQVTVNVTNVQGTSAAFDILVYYYEDA